MIGVMVGATLLALYRVTSIFIKASQWVADIYSQSFQLPATPVLVTPLQYAYYTVMAFVSAFVCAGSPRLGTKIRFLGGALFLTLLLSPILAFNGWLFEPLSGMVAIVLAGLGGMLYGASDDGRKGHEVGQWMSGRVSSQQMNRLMATPETVDLNAKRELTILVCRVLNSQELCQQVDPTEVAHTITDFMSEASDHLVKKGGYLDVCNVEGIRAVFGMAEPLSEHALAACRAALSLERHLEAWKDRTQTKAIFGIAIATGPAIVAVFGASDHRQLSVLGEPADFSRRLCSINYVYGSKVLLSARTYHLAKESVEARPMEMVSAPRLHQISEVYELMDEKGKLNEEQTKARDAFWHGVVSLRKGAYKEAVGHLKRAQMEGRDDAPLKYFLERAEAGMKEDRVEPEGKIAAKHVRVLTAS
jgi:class 3 adenylate cyclase